MHINSYCRARHRLHHCIQDNNFDTTQDIYVKTMFFSPFFFCLISRHHRDHVTAYNKMDGAIIDERISGSHQ
jgi:hypothetical protein